MARIVDDKRFVCSDETLMCIDILKSISPGETVTYGWLSDASGLDVIGSDRNHLDYARSKLQKDGEAVFVAISTIGLRRLRNEEIPRHATDRHRKRFENDTRRYAHALACTNVDALPDDQKDEYRYSRAMLGIRQAIVDQTKTTRGSRYGAAMQPHLQIDETDLVQRLRDLSSVSLDPGHSRRRMMHGV